MSRVFIEFSVGDNSDRLEIQLFDHRCPKAIANFLYLLSAHEIPDHIITAKEKSINGPLPAPLKASRILRIQQGKQIDFGVSGTDSVYGGCYDDEAVGPTEQQQSQLKSAPHPNFLHDFGTISVANCGPNLNGSKYFICLDRRPEIDGYHQIIGTVAPQSLQALRNLASCKVNVKKGFVPEPAVKIYDCGIIRANENWKQTALGTDGATNNNNNNNNQQQQQPQTSRLKLLKGRGSQLEKRMAQGDAETLMNQEENEHGGNNNSNQQQQQQPQTFGAALEAAEIARRRAKRRRIEDAAVGSGAWVEPPEVSSGTATRGGVVGGNNTNNSNNNNSGNGNNYSQNIKFGPDYTPKNSQQGSMSFSQAYQAARGDMNEAQRIMEQSRQTQMSERNMFAVAARANQFLQDVTVLGAQHKSKHLKQQRKKRSLKYS